MWWQARVLLLLQLALSGLAKLGPAGAGGQIQEATVADPEPFVCIIVRTYWRHGSFGSGDLTRLLASFSAQTHTKWELMLVVMDSRPFPDLRYIVRDSKDARIHVYAEWIARKFKPRSQNGHEWAKGYHTKLYNLTDAAIRACPPQTRWVLVTNGDNQYDPRLLAELVKHKDAQLVAFNYQSRYQRPTASPCERFSASPGAPNCKENGLEWCQTDLSASAYSWPALLATDLRFATQDPMGNSSGHDGMLAAEARKLGFKTAHVAHLCLVDHSPSPQFCARSNGVWDDSESATNQHSGGQCLTQAEAVNRLKSHDDLERISLSVTHDQQSFGFTPGQNLTMDCIRKRDRNTWMNRKWFGKYCVAPYDKRLEAAAAHKQ